MNREFVSYEIALKLKVLGFDEPCFGQFYKHPTQKEEEFRLFHDCVWEDRTTSYWRTNISDHFVSVPTYSQAFRFFRDKYEIGIEGFVHKSIEGNYYFVIKRLGNNESNMYEFTKTVPKIFDSYEEAEIACLENLIELVESKSE